MAQPGGAGVVQPDHAGRVADHQPAPAAVGEQRPDPAGEDVLDDVPHVAVVGVPQPYGEVGRAGDELVGGGVVADRVHPGPVSLERAYRQPGGGVAEQHAAVVAADREHRAVRAVRHRHRQPAHLEAVADAHGGRGQAGRDRTARRDDGAAQLRGAQQRRVGADVDQRGAVPAAAGDARAAQVGTEQSRPGQLRVAQVRPGEAGLVQAGAAQAGVFQPRLGQVGGDQPRVGQVGAGQVGPGEFAVRQVLAAQHRAAQVGPVGQAQPGGQPQRVGAQRLARRLVAEHPRGPGGAAGRVGEVAEELHGERGQRPHRQRGRFLTAVELLGHALGDEPLHDRGVDEPEQPVVGADQQAARADRVRRLRAGQPRVGPAGELAGGLGQLGQAAGTPRRSPTAGTPAGSPPATARGGAGSPARPGCPGVRRSSKSSQDSRISRYSAAALNVPPAPATAREPPLVQVGDEAEHARVAGEPEQVLDPGEQVHPFVGRPARRRRSGCAGTPRICPGVKSSHGEHPPVRQQADPLAERGQHLARWS